jgi:hypothetical protein
MKKATTQSDILVQAATGVQYTSSGKNFKPLIAAGSWTISGFHYGKSRCACCGRPILHVLHLGNESHRAESGFTETIEVGIVCGPKVFMQSCIGFYEDPAREWERQFQVWKDYVNYIILCVKHEQMWQLVPEELRTAMDSFLKDGYEKQDHSGGWWMVKDSKKRFLRAQKRADIIPSPYIIADRACSLIYAARRQGLIPQDLKLDCDLKTGKLTLVKDAKLAVSAIA